MADCSRFLNRKYDNGNHFPSSVSETFQSGQISKRKGLAQIIVFTFSLVFTNELGIDFSVLMKENGRSI